MKITKKKSQDILRFMQDIAYEAGEIILKYQKKRQSLVIIEKGADGIASEADQASEKFLISAINQKYPSHLILSEEDYSENKIQKLKNKDKFIWVIDPLDGTNNFVNGIPIYAISIALVYNKKTIVGLVYNPLSGECFYAAENFGAYLVDYRINPLKTFELKSFPNEKNMSDCIFSPSPIYTKSNKFESQLSTFNKNITGARAVRRLGSAALELCYVANGNFDAYWEQNLKPWDVAAAILICEESGVLVSEYNGRRYTIGKDSIMAARAPLHGKIIGKIKK